MLHPPTRGSREAAFAVALQAAQRKAALPRLPDGKGAAGLTAVGSSRVFGPAADPLFCSALHVRIVVASVDFLINPEGDSE